MIPVYDAAAVRAADAHVIEAVGVPGPVLMENAGRLTAQVILRRYPDAVARGVLVMCGKGNNGGDGYVIARHLALAGVRVEVAGQAGRHTEDAAIFRAVCVRMGVAVDAKHVTDGFGLVVDALLGTGIERDLRDDMASSVAMINRFDGPVVAVDLPTGLHADSGAVMGDAVRASMTVTYGFLKAGLLLEPGADYVGDIVLADIGLGVASATGFDVGPARFQVAQASDVLRMLPTRSMGGHKGSNGHLGVLAGSETKAGAAVLVANAAIRAGAGLVTLLIPKNSWARLEGLRPEVMVEEPDQLSSPTFHALAIGPGVGSSEPAVARMRSIWRDDPRPVIVDADGLNALVGFHAPPGGPRLLTPHPGEAGRLLETTSVGVQADRLGTIDALLELSPTLLKGRHTLVAAQGTIAWMNPTGGPQLSTAGSGDVLTGVIGAFMAQGLRPVDAGICAAYLHGLAVADAAGPIVAGDIIERLPGAFERLANAPSPFLRVGP